LEAQIKKLEDKVKTLEEKVEALDKKLSVFEYDKLRAKRLRQLGLKKSH